MYFLFPANEGFDLRSINIRAAFLQSKGLDREVHWEHPRDILKEGILWKLTKPLYGLNDASKKVKEVFIETRIMRVQGPHLFFHTFAHPMRMTKTMTMTNS